MGLIGRTCCECFGTGYHEHESMQAGKLPSSTCETCAGCGRVVPLSTHQGAVEALEAIAEDRVPGVRTVQSVVQAYAQGVLARLGGR